MRGAVKENCFGLVDYLHLCRIEQVML